MGERRKARRYEVYLPLQVCISHNGPAEFFTAQLRDVSRTGIYFQSNVALEEGSGLELTFALPTEKDRGASVLVRASARALRVSPLAGEIVAVYGVAAGNRSHRFCATCGFDGCLIRSLALKFAD